MHLHIGSDIEIIRQEKFNALIITNKWIVSYEKTLPREFRKVW